ncbi:hypothetical protein JTB14_030290 [Gonioctena quinquepunctata]|nr:hypothetical protein JTB14_030290 [Gonioctena quinquepunctata]
MRADKISLIAKKDTLICNYGYSYLKGRRSKGNLDVVRQNMRRLARLLKFAQNENREMINLIDLLRPSFFKTIIAGVNEIACYNSETDIYESPTVAVNFGTLIKKCCDLAYIYLLQIPNTNDERKKLKILKTLVTSQWANEVSAQAASNLNAKKWNKDELIPLTSDLMKMNNFLQETSEAMYNKILVDENNYLAYNTLKEVLYTQIILLNRRRPAEVAQIKVQTYTSVNLDSRNENEFENCLTETERVLLTSYSRIMIRGKRGRGVPILLSVNMRKHFDCLMKIRNNFVSHNDYVFHTSGDNFIDGTKVLYKYAKKCGVRCPKSISATRLRKHLATVTQLLQFSEKDLEQLLKFMGHTLNIHCNVYRLSDSLYQTAKVSKLLLLATEEGVEQYKGMKLDDIDIDLNPMCQENTNFNSISEVIEDIKGSSHVMPRATPEDELYEETVEKSVVECPEKGVVELPKGVIIIRKPWTKQQKQIISNYFSNHIERKQAPKKHEINEFVEKYPKLFTNRKWTSIKAVVFNLYKGNLKG